MIKKFFQEKFKDMFYLNALTRELRDCNSVLDVGCGSNSGIKNVKGNIYKEGIDVYKKSIFLSKKKKIHNKYKLGDVRNIDRYYNKKTFDATIAIDVIEHLTKKEAISLIKKMEKIAKKKVIILTPNGFYHQDKLDGNPHQIHLSGWSKKDFENLGYRVVGLRGLKHIRGEHASIKYKPWFLWGTIAFITEPLLYFYPRLSYDIFAVKKL